MIKRKIGSSFGGKISSVSEPHVDDSHLIDESQLIYNKDKKIGCGGSHGTEPARSSLFVIPYPLLGNTSSDCRA